MMQIKWMSARKIYECRPIGFHHRNRKQFTKLHKTLNRTRITADIFRDCNRVLGAGNDLQCLIDGLILDGY
jgi:hypothetical protein